MRVLLLAPQPFYQPRGTPIAVRAVAEGLAALGHQVELLAYFEGQDVVMPGVTIHRIPRPWGVRKVPVGVSWQKLPCDFVMYQRAAKMLARGGYGAIHAVEEAGFIARLLAKRFALPYVFDMDSRMSSQIVETNPWYWPVSMLFGALERWAIRGSAGVLAVCPLLVDYAKQHQRTGNVALLPDLPVPPVVADGGPPLQLPDVPAGHVKLLYVGNLEAYQGVDLMLEAFALAAGRRADATLTVVGGLPEHVERNRAKAQSLQWSGRVVFTGPRPLEVLPRVLRWADVLVSPRRKGINTPMKVYNYMQAGRAIVATNLPTHTQVLDATTAVLTEPTPAALAEGMVALIDDPQRRERLGAAAQRRVEEEYGPARWLERLRGFYAGIGEQAANKGNQR